MALQRMCKCIWQKVDIGNTRFVSNSRYAAYVSGSGDSGSGDTCIAPNKNSLLVATILVSPPKTVYCFRHKYRNCHQKQSIASNIRCIEDNIRCIEDNIRCIEGNMRCIEGNMRCIDGNIRCIGGNATLVKGNATLVKGNARNVGGNARNVGGNTRNVGGNARSVRSKIWVAKRNMGSI